MDISFTFAPELNNGLQLQDSISGAFFAKLMLPTQFAVVNFGVAIDIKPDVPSGESNFVTFY
jgi:hypothetical protein